MFEASLGFAVFKRKERRKERRQGGRKKTWERRKKRKEGMGGVYYKPSTVVYAYNLSI